MDDCGLFAIARTRRGGSPQVPLPGTLQGNDDVCRPNRRAENLREHATRLGKLIETAAMVSNGPFAHFYYRTVQTNKSVEHGRCFSAGQYFKLFGCQMIGANCLAIRSIEKANGQIWMTL